MDAKVERTFLGLDVARVHLRVDEPTRRQLEALVHQSPRFRRNVSVSEFLYDGQRDLQYASRARMLEPQSYRDRIAGSGLHPRVGPGGSHPAPPLAHQAARGSDCVATPPLKNRRVWRAKGAARLGGFDCVATPTGPLPIGATIPFECLLLPTRCERLDALKQP